MEVAQINFQDTNQFSRLFLDYINQEKNLEKFYGLYPSLENIQSVSEQHGSINRTALVEELENQYKGCCTLSEPVQKNISLLKEENTFTITTGHQLNLATGPLFFVFKIITTIKLAKELSSKYPDQNFVPVFWMASEDHDFEEINHFNLFGKKYEWNTNQTGAVGRFKTEGIQEVLEQLPEAIDLLKDAYQQPTLSQATRFIVNELFGDHGLIILDADSSRLKKEFIPTVEKELFERTSEKFINEASDELTRLGYKTQVHPREINLFYLTDTLRERIVFENEKFKVKNTDLSFSQEEIKEELIAHPERFSPNVILRPIYQQQILPNLAYIGGPGEIAYWLQLKSVFDSYNTILPAIVPRNFGLLLSSTDQKKIKKLDLSPKDIFKSFEKLKIEYIQKAAETEPTISPEIELMKEVFQGVVTKAKEVDGSLEGAMKADWARLEKQLEGIDKRIKKAEERKHDTALQQIEGLKNKLFPHGGLQERHENIFSFIVNEPELLKTLLAKCDPLDFRMNVFHL